MYIKRSLEKLILEMNNYYPVIMVLGPRQVGKSTMLEELSKQLNTSYNQVSLDDMMIRNLAKNDPELFLQRYKTPLIIDEFQYAPELLSYIKINVDKSKQNGSYWLTGSQSFIMMKNVSESLAGRVGIVNMFSLSYNEISNRNEVPFLPIYDRVIANRNSNIDSVDQVFERIFRGSMPKLITNPKMNSENYFSSYVQTYIERDIRDIVKITNETKFMRFIASIASRTGQELVYEDLARDCDIDNKTAQNWLSLLVSTGLVYLLQPYFNNAIKRIVKRPKIIFMDTGLCAYLARYTDAQTLEISAFAGHIFETYVISEIIKSYLNNGKEVNNRLFYYRDNNQKEIDLLIIENGTVYPIEIKKNANPGIDAMKHFNVLENFNLNIGEGAVICLCQSPKPLNRNVTLYPLNYI